jgi:hypothetical protein
MGKGPTGVRRGVAVGDGEVVHAGGAAFLAADRGAIAEADYNVPVAVGVPDDQRAELSDCCRL